MSQNKKLNKAVFDADDWLERVDKSVQTAYKSEEKQTVTLFSIGDTLSHHSTVILFEPLGMVFKFDVAGAQDSGKLICRVKKIEKFEPRGESTYSDSGYTFKDVLLHCAEISNKFGQYDYINNSCQQWNDSFLKYFRLKRRTFADLWRAAWGLGLAGMFGGLVVAAATFFGTPLMRITN